MWINRISGLFHGSLGFLGGMSVIHLIMIGYVEDHKQFLNIYCPYSLILNLIFLLLTNFCAIFGITVTLIYK